MSNDRNFKQPWGEKSGPVPILSEIDSNKILARAWLRKERQKWGSSYIDEQEVLMLAKFLTDYLRERP